MLAEGLGRWSFVMLGGNLELDNHLPRLTWSTEVKSFRSMCLWLGFVRARILLQNDLWLVGDNEITSIYASRVVNVDRNIGHLSCKEKVLRHGHIHVRLFCVHKANLLFKRHHLAEFRVIDNGTQWTEANALTIAHFTLPPLIDQQISIDWDELCLEEIAELAAQWDTIRSEVEWLGQKDVIWNLEREGD